MEKMQILSSFKTFYSLEDYELVINKSQNIIRFKQYIHESINSSPLDEKKDMNESDVQSEEEDKEKKSIKSILSEGKSPLRRLEKIKNLFRDHQILTSKEIVKIVNHSPPTITNDLKTLCNQKFIKKIKPTGSPRSHYFEFIK